MPIDTTETARPKFDEKSQGPDLLRARRKAQSNVAHKVAEQRPSQTANYEALSARAKSLAAKRGLNK